MNNLVKIVICHSVWMGSRFGTRKQTGWVKIQHNESSCFFFTNIAVSYSSLIETWESWPDVFLNFQKQRNLEIIKCPKWTCFSSVDPCSSPDPRREGNPGPFVAQG